MFIVKNVLLLLIIFNLNPLFSQTTINRQFYNTNINEAPVNINDNGYYYRDLLTEPGKESGDYIIGPEIPVEGTSGFNDYQSNGDCRRHVYRFSANILMSVFLTAVDSLNITASRRTVYSGSTNDGSNWSFISHVPQNSVSAFPSLTTTITGAAVICKNPLNNTVAKEVTPLSGIFSYYNLPANLIQSGCSRLSNGKILIAGLMVSDTAAAMIYDPNSNTFANINRFFIGNNMIATHSAGPDGKALMLFVSNNAPGKIYISFTTNSGQFWSMPQVVFQAGLINGEYASPFTGIDAIYDNSGNYYIAFNTTDTAGYYSSAKLWVSKNGGVPVIVSQHTGINSIPDAANILGHAQFGMCTIDHPSLSISSDDSILYVSYEVLFQNDTLNGFNKSHIFISTSLTQNLQFSVPIKVTNSGPQSFDERYSSLNQRTPYLDPVNKRTIYLVYQKDPQPGSCVFYDNAPISRASLIFRKITDLTYPVIGIINNNNNNPKDYALYQNYPNPFNPETRIDFQIPVDSRVKISLFNLIGQQLHIIIDKNFKKGTHNVIFNSTEFSSGIYFYKLEAGKVSLSKKMTLLK